MIQTINQERWTGFCASDCIDCYTLQTNVSVLGALPANRYNFLIYSHNDDGHNLADLILSFEVTNTISSTLAFPTNSTGTNISFQVADVQGVKYIVQSSTNLVNWVSVSTNIGGPFEFKDFNLQTSSSRFYRTLILSHDE